MNGDNLHFTPPAGRLGIILCDDRVFRTRVFLQLAGTLASGNKPFPFPNPVEDGPCAPEMRGCCKKFDTCTVRKAENEPIVSIAKKQRKIAVVQCASPLLDHTKFCSGDFKNYTLFDMTDMDIVLSKRKYSLSVCKHYENGCDIPLDNRLKSYDFVFMNPLWGLSADNPIFVLKRLCALAERLDAGIILETEYNNKYLEFCMEAFAWRMEIETRYRWRGGHCEQGWEIAVYDGDTLVRRKVPVIYDAKQGRIRIAGRDEFPVTS